MTGGTTHRRQTTQRSEDGDEGEDRKQCEEGEKLSSVTRTFLLAAALSVSSALACRGSGAGAQARAGAVADIPQMTGAYDEAWLEKDVAAVERALAPGYVYLSSTGEVWSRERTMAMLRSPSYDLTSASREEVEVRRYDGAAIVTARWRGSGTDGGKPFRDDQRCSLVWVKGDREWQVALEQCTNVARPT